MKTQKQIEQTIWDVLIERGVNVDGNLIAIDREGIEEIARRLWAHDSFTCTTKNCPACWQESQIEGIR